MSSDLPQGRRLVLASAAAVLFLALFPQLFFMLTKQGAWNGSYFVSNYDEPAYSAYVNSLITGKPRTNDPFLPVVNDHDPSQPESLYSIQFIPAYAVAVPARLVGLDASIVFILLAAMIAVLSVLAIYKLLLDATGDDLLAALGPVVILCLGTAAAFQGELRQLIEGRVLTDFLPFLRRYQPGAAFPLFFVFCLLFLRSMKAETKKTCVSWAAGAGAVFVVLVFSYFFLWTAAAAWAVCFAGLVIAIDRSRVHNVVTALAVVAGIAALPLVNYGYLLSQRAAEMDSVQLLTFTRAPEFLSPSMLVGLAVAAAAVYLLKGGSQMRSLPLILSFALTPVILFNQQIVTGMSIQPVHYELFISNYIVLTAAMLLLAGLRAEGGELSPQRFGRTLGYLAAAAFAWGLFEAYGSTSRNFMVAEIRDASVPAIQAAAGTEPAVILATNFVTSDYVPTVAAARSYWNPHTSSAGGIGVEENKRLFYSYLYFSGYTEHDLEAALKANSFEVVSAIFGAERALPSLGSGVKAVSIEEMSAEVKAFSEFSRRLEADSAYSPAITHVIVPTDAHPSLVNLDRWYARGEGQNFGLFTLYPVTPKPGT